MMATPTYILGTPVFEALVRLAGAAIRWMSERAGRRRKPPRHYGYHDLGNGKPVFKYTGSKNQPPYRCIYCQEVLQLRSQRRIAAGSTLQRIRYRSVRYLVCVNGHIVQVAANFKV